MFLGGLALLLRFLQKNLEEALTARVGNWLKSGRVLGLSALLGIFVWLLLASERPYCACSIVLVATGYFLIQRFRPQLVSSVGRSLVASVIATAAVGAALALDVNFAYSQQADLDVVVVLTPREELSNAGNVKTVFANLRRALAEPLKDVKNIAIARGTTPLERGLSVRTPIHRVSPLAGSRC